MGGGANKAANISLGGERKIEMSRRLTVSVCERSSGHGWSPLIPIAICAKKRAGIPAGFAKLREDAWAGRDTV